MMKKVIFLFLITLTLFLLPLKVQANMAAPRWNDVGTTMSFQNNEDLKVTKEVLDLRFNKEKVNITARYYMENLKNEAVQTLSMFISPNIENSSAKVLIDETLISYDSDIYYAIPNNDVLVDDWKFYIEKDTENHEYCEVNAITFKLAFKPKEEKVIEINYDYLLGGRANLKDNMRYGTLTYYLSPAKAWEGFEDLTINLYLDNYLPVLADSSLDFQKVSKNTYKYHSDTLPNEELTLLLHLNGFQNFILSFKNPYIIGSIFVLYLPLVLIILIPIIIVVVIIVHKHKKGKRKKDERKEE